MKLLFTIYLVESNSGPFGAEKMFTHHTMHTNDNHTPMYTQDGHAPGMMSQFEVHAPQASVYRK